MLIVSEKYRLKITQDGIKIMRKCGRINLQIIYNKKSQDKLLLLTKIVDLTIFIFDASILFISNMAPLENK